MEVGIGSMPRPRLRRWGTMEEQRIAMDQECFEDQEHETMDEQRNFFNGFIFPILKAMDVEGKDLLGLCSTRSQSLSHPIPPQLRRLLSNPLGLAILNCSTLGAGRNSSDKGRYRPL
uniref:Uncharacterized protein n=1 Tax=Lygus hesperus TaxID=30085 RepID=A0A146LRA8_LYGHE